MKRAMRKYKVFYCDCTVCEKMFPFMERVRSFICSKCSEGMSEEEIKNKLKEQS